MKKLLLLAVSCLISAGVYAADDCKDLSQYQVSKTSFSRVPLKVALTKLTAGTPYEVDVVGDLGMKVSGDAISGPLSSVLDALSREAKFSYVTDQCSLRVTVDGATVASSERVPVTPVWILRKGHPIGKELREWGLKAGPAWDVQWQMKRDYIVPADTTYPGDFKSAATQVVKTLADNGLLIRATFYDGNRVMLVTGPGVAEQ